MDGDRLRQPSRVDSLERLPAERLGAATRDGRKQKGADPTVPFFYALLAVHLLLWTLLPLWTQPNLSAETVSLLAQGRAWEWGYYDHPPLPAWLAYGVCWLFGGASWPTYLLAQLSAAACLWAGWKMAREFLHPWTAVCAALALEGCLFYTLFSPELGWQGVGRCWWALSIVTFYRAMVGNRRRAWMGTGLFLGLGLLSSYDTLLLAGAFVLFTLWDRRARQCWDSSRPILGVLLLALIVLPHALWLWRSDFLTIRTLLAAAEVDGSLTRHLVAPVRFGLVQLTWGMAVLLLLIPLIRSVQFQETGEQPHQPDAGRQFLGRYLVWVTLLPIAVALAFPVVTGINLQSIWAGSQWTFAGVALLLWSRLNEERTSWRRSILACGATAGALAATLVVNDQLLPAVRGQGKAIHFPAEELATVLQSTWQERHPDRPLTVVGGPRWLAANAGWHLPQSPRLYFDLDPQKSSGVDDAALAETGGVIVWQADERDAAWREVVQSRFQNCLILEQPVPLKWKTKRNVSPVQINVAVIAPHDRPGAGRSPLDRATWSSGEPVAMEESVQSSPASIGGSVRSLDPDSPWKLVPDSSVPGGVSESSTIRQTSLQQGDPPVTTAVGRQGGDDRPAPPTDTAPTWSPWNGSGELLPRSAPESTLPSSIPPAALSVPSSIPATIPQRPAPFPTSSGDTLPSSDGVNLDDLVLPSTGSRPFFVPED